MRFIPGECVFCRARIADRSSAAKSYNEIKVLLKCGTFLHIGLCDKCDPTEDQLKDAVEAYNNYVKALSKKCSDHEFDKLVDRLTYVDVLKRNQLGTCVSCGKDLTDKWILTNGALLHEKCKIGGKSVSF